MHIAGQADAQPSPIPRRCAASTQILQAAMLTQSHSFLPEQAHLLLGATSVALPRERAARGPLTEPLEFSLDCLVEEAMAEASVRCSCHA